MVFIHMFKSNRCTKSTKFRRINSPNVLLLKKLQYQCKYLYPKRVSHSSMNVLDFSSASEILSGFNSLFFTSFTSLNWLTNQQSILHLRVSLMIILLTLVGSDFSPLFVDKSIGWNLVRIMRYYHVIALTLTTQLIHLKNHYLVLWKHSLLLKNTVLTGNLSQVWWYLAYR